MKRKWSTDEEEYEEFMAWKNKQKKEQEEEEEDDARDTSEEEDAGVDPTTSAYSQFQNEMLRAKGFDNMTENQKYRTAKRRVKFQPSKGLTYFIIFKVDVLAAKTCVF